MGYAIIIFFSSRKKTFKILKMFRIVFVFLELYFFCFYSLVDSSILKTTIANEHKETITPSPSKLYSLIIKDTKLLGLGQEINKIKIVEENISCHYTNVQVVFEVPIKGVMHEVTGYLHNDKTIGDKQEKEVTCRKIRRYFEIFIPSLHINF